MRKKRNRGVFELLKKILEFIQENNIEIEDKFEKTTAMVQKQSKLCSIMKSAKTNR